MDPMSTSSEDDIQVTSQGIVARYVVGSEGACYIHAQLNFTKSHHCAVEASSMVLPNFKVP